MLQILKELTDSHCVAMSGQNPGKFFSHSSYMLLTLILAEFNA
jgi:hypothetical protein